MKTAKDYYDISVLDGMLVTDKESVIEAIQMVIDDAGREAVEFAEWIASKYDRQNIEGSLIWGCRTSSIIRTTKQIYSLFKNKDNDTTR